MAIDYSPIKTQIETDIAALTGSEPLEDLLAIAKIADSVGATRTALDSAIQANIVAAGSAGSQALEDMLALVKSDSRSSIIKSVQRGYGTGVITISSVDMSKSVTNLLTIGGYSKADQTQSLVIVAASIRLTSETTINIDTIFGDVSWEVIEYA